MQNDSENHAFTAIRNALLLSVGRSILRAFVGAVGPRNPGFEDEEPVERPAEAGA
ncbi:MAG: hypothetical protein ACYS47_10815 [Planctomycetota bacterium]|jgi:hypothetical protein